MLIEFLDDLDQHGFSIIDDAYSPEYQQQVAQPECSQNLDQFREAAIQNGVVSKIRSDHILWITTEDFKHCTTTYPNPFGFGRTIQSTHFI